MKKITTLFVAGFCLLQSAAYSQRVCGTVQHEQWLQQQNPKRPEQRKAFEEAVQRYIERQKTERLNGNNSTQAIIKIPLVVHVVFSGATDSVGDAQIFSQINILNQDYTRTNPDTVNTPAAFVPVAGAPMIQYCWAQQDPNGNPTNGIERRKNTSTTSWSTDDKVKSYATGGLDAWDPSRYFNVWVCNLGGGILGYGEFPGISLSNTYGFVAAPICFGNTGLAQAPYNGGRTATHEIGHCFNLLHIWGDDGGTCTGSDQCADTPNQGSENYGCPTYPLTDACTTTAPGVMFMNYMDYTDDICMNIFTKDQSLLMVAVLNNPPYNSLATSTACNAVVLQANDAGVTTAIQPTGNSCSTTIVPKVVIKNWGTNVMTSCTVNYQIDNGTVQTYPWTGNLASLASATVTLPSMTTTGGSHVFTAYCAQPNGGADGNSSNDTTQTNFVIITTGATLPLVEGFESTSFPPTSWTLNNPDGQDTWARTTTAFKTGAASAVMDNYTTSYTGQLDELITPVLDMTNATNPQMTFQLAYKLYTNPTTSPNFSDTLQILASSDCGATYTSVYKKYGATGTNSLTTTSPAWANAAFTPTSSQWRMETVSLSGFAGASGVSLKFRNISDYENFLYIDDINIADASSTGINARNSLNGINIYPNPSADGNFTVDVKKNEYAVQKIAVYDLLGKKVFELDGNVPAGMYNMNLSNLSSGTYMVQIIKDNQTIFTKIVINK